MISFFFAFFPAADEATTTYMEAVRLKKAYGFRSSLTGLRKLHMTVHFVARLPERDAALEGALSGIGNALRPERFEVTMEYAETLKAHGSAPSVFVPGSVPAELVTLAAELRNATGRLPGIAPPEHDFRPHVTWMRSKEKLPRKIGVPPICWSPARLSLAIGVPGAHTYEMIRSWPLGS